MRKAGFGKAVLGLSGGVDSALVAAIACDALGPENVRCVMLPLALHLRGIVDGRRAPWRSGWDAGSTPYPLAAHMSP